MAMLAVSLMSSFCSGGGGGDFFLLTTIFNAYLLNDFNSSTTSLFLQTRKFCVYLMNTGISADIVVFIFKDTGNTGHNFYQRISATCIDIASVNFYFDTVS